MLDILLNYVVRSCSNGAGSHGTHLVDNRVSRLYAFGSHVNSTFGRESDVDAVVEVDAPEEEGGEW